jgi:hypothetical protein
LKREPVAAYFFGLDSPEPLRPLSSPLSNRFRPA